MVEIFFQNGYSLTNEAMAQLFSDDFPLGQKKLFAECINNAYRPYAEPYLKFLPENDIAEKADNSMRLG